MNNRIYIVGIGPGREEMMTGEAVAALEQADVIVGYTVYVKLLGERFAGKKLLTTPMRQETKRCELCFREAEAGKRVALICSGDAGIYGLESLMYGRRTSPDGTDRDPRYYSGKQWGGGTGSTLKP